MQSSEKLDFLMKISNTSNSELGRALGFDPSYISRMRYGRRGFPKNKSFAEPAAYYFATHMSETYQKMATAGVICPTQPWPEDPDIATNYITEWLEDGEHYSFYKSIDDILMGLSSSETEATREYLETIFRDRALTQTIESDKTEESDSPDKFQKNDDVQEAEKSTPSTSVSADQTTQFYFGNAGRRDAFLELLTHAINLDEPFELVLHSDENLHWFVEDPSFSRRWAELMEKCVEKDCKITLIRSFNRDISEVMADIKSWIPLYLKQKFETVYLPHKKECSYGKTIFIVPGKAVLFASSVEQTSEAQMTILTTETQVVNSLHREISEILPRCKKFVEIYTNDNLDGYWTALEQLNSNDGSLVTAGPVPSFQTMPQIVLQSINERTTGKQLNRMYTIASNKFNRALNAGRTLVEILNLPDPRSIHGKKVFFPSSDFFEDESIYYTTEEFVNHLTHLLFILKKWPNYHVKISSIVSPELMVKVNEECGAVVSRTLPPSAAMVSFDLRIANLFYQHLLLKSSEESATKEEEIEALENYIKRLQA